MRHLVMLSGGPDSALALKQALTGTDDPVAALHVSMITGSNRHEYERLAARRIVECCRRRIRPFDYLTATCVPPQGGAYADVPILGAFAAMACNRFGDVGKTWIGMDVQQDDGAVDAAFREVMRAAIFSKRFPDTLIPAAHSPQPGKNLSKQAIRKALGEELWALSWSCRAPHVGGQVCGACESCLERKTTYVGT